MSSLRVNTHGTRALAVIRNYHVTYTCTHNNAVWGARLSITEGHTVIKAAIVSIKIAQHARPEWCNEIVTQRWKPRLCFYQTRSAWSVDQGSNKNHSPAYNFAPTVTKFCVMWEGLSLPHDTKFGNCRCKIVDSRAFPSWSLIHGLRWSGLIKAEPG